MENEAASNAVVGVKDRDLPWSIVSTQFDSGKVQPPRSLAIRTFSQHSDFFQRGAIKKILAAVNASHHAAQIPNKFRGSAIRV